MPRQIDSTGPDNALAKEELAGLALATWVRCAIMAVMATLLALEAPTEANLYYLAMMALFAVLGLAHLGLARLAFAKLGFGVAALKYAFTLLDVALVAVALILPNPLGQPDLPLPTTLRFAIFPYFYLMLAFTAFGFTPFVVLWQGLAITAVWGAAVYLVMILPETVTEQDFLVLDVQDWMQMYFDPQFLSLRDAIEQGFVFILVAATLATVVWRSRRLAEREGRAARERANLSRYFSPNVVEELASLDEPLATVQSQDVGVVFVDIVGFTKICETLEPNHVMSLLRAYHGRVERIVFEHGGTLNKYIGDGAMATFGTPRTGPDDAVNTVACVFSLAEEFRAWNAERAKQGLTPILAGIGAHYGPAILGDIGTERQLEFAVIGDTVNVASRLESLTRDLGTQANLSGALVEAARLNGGDGVAQLSALDQAPAQDIRGRKESIEVWTLARAS